AKRRVELEARAEERRIRAEQRRAHAEMRQRSEGFKVMEARDEILDALREDKLIGRRDTKVEFALSGEDRMRLDGRTQPSEVGARYRAMLTELGFDCDSEIELELDGKRVSMKIESEGSTTRIDIDE
ncbi:MAG: hypothetical protein WBF53_09845, partial [Litorimonas sp.]